MNRMGKTAKAHRVWLAAFMAAVVVLLAALVGIAGCAAGGDESVSTTAAAATDRDWAEEARSPGADVAFDQANDGEVGSSTPSATPAVAGGDPATLTGTAGQKVISDAQLEIEVEKGAFETVFDQALLLADRYGGYVVSSGSYASDDGEEETLKSGTIAIRVPATSFNRALADAAKLGEVRNRQVQTQDVTEEYVDLEARIANSESHVQALLALLAKAGTVEEILQVQQVLTNAQQQLEQLKGRLRYLDEHTSYSTLTLSLYETGAEVLATSEWGFVQALKDGLRNLVGAVNALVRGLGVVLPALVVLAIIVYVVYRLWSRWARRRREEEARRYQPYPEGAANPTGGSAASTAAAAGSASSAPSAPAMASGETGSTEDGAAR